MSPMNASENARKADTRHEERSSMNEDEEELFESAGSATALLSVQRAAERRLFKERAQETFCLGAEDRRCVLISISEFMVKMRMPPNLGQRTCLDAMALIDAYAANMSGEVSKEAAIGELPAVATAAIKMLLKMDCVYARFHSDDFIGNMFPLVARLRTLGHQIPDLTGKRIQDAERKIFASLGGQVVVWPTIAYFEKFILRINLLSKNNLRARMTYVWHAGCAEASRLTSLLPASAQLPPSVMAVGIFALSLVRAGLLHPDDVCPPGLSTDGWRQILRERLHVAQTEYPPVEGRALISHLLAAAAALPLDEVRSACGLIARAVA